MRVIEIDGDLDDDVMQLLLVSGKLRTKEQIKRETVLDAIDPIIPMGPEFEFEQRPDDEMYISLEVPDSGDRVDLAVAWQVALLDAKACSLLLERDHSLEATLLVYRNTFCWLKFWCCRHPNDMLRLKFHQELVDRKAGLEELRSRATMMFRFDVLGELKTM